MQSERATMADRLKSEGDKEAQRIRSDAEVVAAETRSRAELEAKQLLGKAEVEAAKSLAILQRDPELANILAGLGTVESALKSKTTLIFDQRTRPFELFQYGGLSTNAINK
jgi:regulator of protease activity HflC (stomatin/prohibitin superfamily)